MADLTAARRAKLKPSQFAEPGKDGYPIDTPGRARSALSRAAANASPAEQGKIRAKVKREYPAMQVTAPGGKPSANGAKKPNSNGRNGNPNGRLAGKLTERLAARDRY